MEIHAGPIDDEVLANYVEEHIEMGQLDHLDHGVVEQDHRRFVQYVNENYM